MTNNNNIKEIELKYLFLISGVFFFISTLFVSESVLADKLIIFSLLIIGIASRKLTILLSFPILAFYSIWIYDKSSAFKYVIPFFLIYIVFFSKITLKFNRSDRILILLVFWITISFIYNLINSSQVEVLNSLLLCYVNFIIIVVFFFVFKYQNIDKSNLYRLFILFMFVLSFIPFFKKETAIQEDLIKRVSGLADVNTFCKFSSIALFLNLNNNLFKSMFKSLITLVLVIATLLTFSKMGVILLFIIFLPYYKMLLNIRFFIPFIILLFISSFFLNKIVSKDMEIGQFIVNRILPETPSAKENSLMNSLSSNRTDIWERALIQWAQLPSTIAFGQGIGTIGVRNEIIFGDSTVMHNSIFDLFLETGVIGVCLYLLYLFFLLYKKNTILILTVFIPLLFLSEPFRFDMFLIFVIVDSYVSNDKSLDSVLKSKVRTTKKYTSELT